MPIATIVIATGTGVGAVAALIGTVVALLAQRRARRRSPESAEGIRVVRLKVGQNGSDGTVVLIHSDEERVVRLAESFRQELLRGGIQLRFDPYSEYICPHIAQVERQKTVDATAAPKEEFGQRELNEAQTLISSGYYRAAIIMLGAVLEYVLREAVCQSNATSADSPKSSIRIVRALFRANVMNKSDVAAATLLIEICGSATHDLTEPSGEEARLATELLKRILRSLLD